MAELLPKHAGPGLREAKANGDELERRTAAGLTARGQLATTKHILNTDGYFSSTLTDRHQWFLHRTVLLGVLSWHTSLLGSWTHINPQHAAWCGSNRGFLHPQPNSLPCGTIANAKPMLHLCGTFSLFSRHTSTDVERLCSFSAGGPREHLAPPTIWILPHANVLEEEDFKKKKKSADWRSTEKTVFMVDHSWTCVEVCELNRGSNMQRCSCAKTNKCNCKVCSKGLTMVLQF